MTREEITTSGKRTDIESVLILGAGPIVIGQACEFDYSGAQACKALKDEGYRVVLVNSNPATIMTDPATAHATYVEPVEWRTVARVIDVERPDALLPTMGGQTALNCALDLVREGVLAAAGVELIGASRDAIDKAEDRERFIAAMGRIGLATPRSAIAHSLEEALQVQSRIGFPCIIRPSFTLGGSGGGVAYNRDEFVEICRRGFDLSPTSELLIDESLLGWKEFEMEVVRDKRDNCIIVCSIENVDPMGIHTGDSITVAPAQTLTDKEYQQLRDASIAVLREIGVETGGANVQFAIDPESGRMVVIEMNPRVSRSSALASKATGFPIAKVATKLAVGYTLDELTNDITGVTPASFEPTIDYVVTKAPRFTFEKFAQADDRLTTQMKSVGEAMAIGRTFKESLQKALRSLETGIVGLDPRTEPEEAANGSTLTQELSRAGAERILYVADAFRAGMDVAEVAEITGIDPWFLAQIEELTQAEAWLRGRCADDLDQGDWWRLKRDGFADARLAKLLGRAEEDVRNARLAAGVKPVFKRVDTCAAEFQAATAYLYSTYEEECEAAPSARRKIMVLGGGPNRIGQGIEFDYCCVHAAFAMREDGYETIMVNCNPETVSTDYDTSDRLYFEPVTLEDVLAIVEVEQPTGVIVQFGGQTPLKLVEKLHAAGVRIIGTSPDAIDRAEDRERFQGLVERLGLRQPANRTVRDVEGGVRAAEEIGYPIVVRPSYVLGGRAMEIVYGAADLRRYFAGAADESNAAPVLLDRFLEQAVEVDVDAVSDGAQVVIGAIDPESGRMVVIEMNPRVSRSSALASKATGFPIAKVATKLAVGYTLDELTNDITGVTPASFEPTIDYVVTKAPRFTFEKFAQADDRLTTQMKSVGEAMAIGRTFKESLQKALRSLETGIVGLDPRTEPEEAANGSTLTQELSRAGAERILYVADAFRAGMDVAEVAEITGIDPWFLAQIEELTQAEAWLRGRCADDLDQGDWWRLKRDGFADARLAKLLGRAEEDVRNARLAAGVKPVFKRVDTCAAEFQAATAYLYSTYEEECEAAPSARRKIMVLGGGPNRIGQGIEFDYCCVHAAFAMREDGYETIMVNCNPETVSTDYDTSDRLYFEPVTLEDVLAIVEVEQPTGVIVQFGGQTPLKLVEKLHAAGVRIIGTSPDAIDRAEDRERFQGLVERLGLRQPANRTVRDVEGGVRAAEEIGYPIVVRPSYVLGGRAMEIVYGAADLRRYFAGAADESNAAPVLLDRFLEQAVEVDVDAVSDGAQVVIGAIMQHIEQAGVHSGDSACSLPPFSLPAEVQDDIRRQVRAMALELGVVGLMNVQLAVQNANAALSPETGGVSARAEAGRTPAAAAQWQVYVLEVNPRASRTVPFVSKCIGVSLAKVAARCMAGKTLEEQGFTAEVVPSHICVKESVFPFPKFPGVDPILGPEMKSTGEVMGVGATFAEAFAKASLGAGDKLPTSGKAFLSVKPSDRPHVGRVGRKLVDLGFDLVATRGTARCLRAAGVSCEVVNKVTEGRPDITDLLRNDALDLIVNSTEGRQAIADSAAIRRLALRHKVCYTTTLSGGEAFCEAIRVGPVDKVRTLQSLHLR